MLEKRKWNGKYLMQLQISNCLPTKLKVLLVVIILYIALTKSVIIFSCSMENGRTEEHASTRTQEQDIDIIFFFALVWLEENMGLMALLRSSVTDDQNIICCKK
ncbi:unnamed protein product [Amoebophrya sp. A25]|nr:unnamed protein product [Amoebophrya sp. A25]|eukprot:GSA25T00001982001.1